MPVIAFCVLVGLAACAEADANPNVPLEMVGWRLTSGKAPTKAEFAAVVAACESKALPRASGKPLDACLADLGLKRVP
jgi:hypothetical protein